jgi:hypothetical protein
MKISRLIPTIILLLITALNSTYAQFKIDAQYRPRFELRNGYQKLAPQGATPAAFISQRSRVSFSYESENFKLKFTPQDVRVWGDEANYNISANNGDNASIDLFEAFAEIKLGQIGWVSIGRQQFFYDNEWLLGARNWNQSGNSNDAVIFKLKPFGWNLHLGATWNAKTEASFDNFYFTDRYKTLSYLWLNKAIKENWNLSIVHIATGLNQTDTTNTINFRQTSGLYTDYKLNNLSILGNAYYQFGKNQAAKPVSAFMFALDAGYKAGKFTPGLGISYHSGNSKTGAALKEDNLFDLLFTARHWYFGLIDYFRTISSNTKGGGLADYYLYLDYKVSKSVSVRNTAHYFQLAKTNAGTPTDKNLGYENDLVLKYKFSDWGAVESGYMFFLPTKSLETIQGVADSKFSNFFYLQLTLTPNLFKSEIVSSK